MSSLQKLINHEFDSFAVRLLNDDHGISEDAFDALIYFADQIGVHTSCLCKFVDCIDGRYFLKSDTVKFLNEQIGIWGAFPDDQR